MTLNDAFELDPPNCRVAGLQSVSGTDGAGWFAAYRNETGAEWFLRLEWQRGERIWFVRSHEIPEEPPGVDWCPGWFPPPAPPTDADAG